MKKVFEGEKFVDQKWDKEDWSLDRYIDCKFKNCYLYNVKVDECFFQDVEFSDCQLIGVDFSRISSFATSLSFKRSLLKVCSFYDLDLKGSIFEDSKLEDLDFTSANLHKASFRKSVCSRCLFWQTNLQEVDFSKACGYEIDPGNNRIRMAIFEMPEVLNLLRSFDICIPGYLS